MKTWLDRHPNVAVLLYSALWLIVAWTTADLLDQRRWGYAVWSLIGNIVAWRQVSLWWKRT